MGLQGSVGRRLQGGRERSPYEGASRKPRKEDGGQAFVGASLACPAGPYGCCTQGEGDSWQAQGACGLHQWDCGVGGWARRRVWRQLTHGAVDGLEGAGFDGLTKHAPDAWGQASSISLDANTCSTVQCHSLQYTPNARAPPHRTGAGLSSAPGRPHASPTSTSLHTHP